MNVGNTAVKKLYYGDSLVNMTVENNGGGGITIDPSLDSGSTNAVANSAITNAINAVSGAIPTTYVSNVRSDILGGIRFFQWEKNNNGSKSYTNIWNFKINNNSVLTSSYNGDVINYNLVETSAITTSITSSSTDSQVPSAKAVYDQIGDIETLLSNI